MTAPTTTTKSKSYGSVALTRGVRVAVSPAFMTDQSDPSSRRYLFAYRIRITNEGEVGVRLVSRRWIVVNAHAQREDIEGDGVVGQQPHLRPGQSFEYSSYCPLSTPWGTMEGTYQMERDDGEAFDAAIARFYLVMPEGAGA